MANKRFGNGFVFREIFDGLKWFADQFWCKQGKYLGNYGNEDSQQKAEFVFDEVFIEIA